MALTHSYTPTILTNSNNMEQGKRTLEEQRIEFSNRRFLATPLAGLIVWVIAGIAGIFFSGPNCRLDNFHWNWKHRLFRFICSRNSLAKTSWTKNKPKNEFDKLFLFTCRSGNFGLFNCNSILFD